MFGAFRKNKNNADSFYSLRAILLRLIKNYMSAKIEVKANTSVFICWDSYYSVLPHRINCIRRDVFVVNAFAFHVVAIFCIVRLRGFLCSCKHT